MKKNLVDIMKLITDSEKLNVSMVAEHSLSFPAIQNFQQKHAAKPEKLGMDSP
jgi:hypothetical protein